MDKAFEIEKGTVADIPLSLIDLDPNQPRKDFEAESLAGLAADIKKVGVQQPITVQPNSEEPGRFYIIYGERRYRASKLVKKKAIPALLYNGKKSDLDILLNQVKENSLRKDLNPMEMAELFYTLHKGHGLKHTEIEKTLQDHNVGKFGRAYIGNIIRLRGLPDWAKDKIRAGEMTAAHGKYLLPAMKSDVVIEEIYNEFCDTPLMTTRELQDAVFYSFNRQHPELTGYKTNFDYKAKCVATGCQKMRKCSNSDGAESTFCLDRNCYATFMSEAKKPAPKSTPIKQDENEPKPNDYTVDDNNRVDVDKFELDHWSDYKLLKHCGFNQSECEGCQHRHDAFQQFLDEDDNNIEEIDDSCFNTSCYDKKTVQAHTAKKLLLNWLTSIVGTRISINPDMCRGLLLWMAANSPAGKKKSIHDDGEYIAYEDSWILNGNDIELDNLLTTHKLTTLEQFIDGASVDAVCALAEYGIKDLQNNTILKLASALKISIDDYRIDQDWLNEHTAEEIETFLGTLELSIAALADIQNAEGEKLDKMLLKHADVIGVPPAIRWAFDNLARADDE